MMVVVVMIMSGNDEWRDEWYNVGIFGYTIWDHLAKHKSHIVLRSKSKANSPG